MPGWVAGRELEQRWLNFPVLPGWRAVLGVVIACLVAVALYLLFETTVDKTPVENWAGRITMGAVAAIAATLGVPALLRVLRIFPARRVEQG